MKLFSYLRFSSLWLIAGLAAALVFTACSLKKPEQVTPVPSEEAFDVNFFVNQDGSFKKFLFGVASESVAGRWSTSFNYNKSMHSNVIFDPYASEGWLIGRELSPSRLHGKTQVGREDLKYLREIIRIPVTKRFYLEAARDSRGRETNEMIENVSRSHWKARPTMKLNLSGIQILDRRYALFGYRNPLYSVGTISHIERNKTGEKNFLGYSVMADYSGLKGVMQARFRINFLEFETKVSPKFQVIPYIEQNSKYLNTLHVINRESGGVHDIHYAAHWDINEDQPIRIRIHCQ